MDNRLDMVSAAPATGAGRLPARPSPGQPVLSCWCAACSAAASATCCPATAYSAAASSSRSRRWPRASRPKPNSPCTPWRCICQRRDCAPDIAAGPPDRAPSSTPFSDGIRILRAIMTLIKQERPLQSFGLTAALLILGLALGLPVVVTSSTADGAAAAHGGAGDRTGVASSLSFVCGLISNPVARGRQGAEAAGLPLDPSDWKRPMTARHVAGAARPSAWRVRCRYGDPVVDRPDETMAAIRSALAQTGVSRHVFVVDQGRGRRASQRLRPSSPEDRTRRWWRLTTTMALPADAIADRRSAMAV